jgi:transcription antitermination factor NusG
MEFKTGWHVLYVRSHSEMKVNERLNKISLDSFVPRFKTIRQWSDRKKTIFKPLFPSYVFVNIHTPLEFHKSLTINGAGSFIKFGNTYARVKEEEINKIKLLVGAEDISNIETNIETPKVGETRRITYGSLNGLECEVLKTGKTNKIIVRIDSLRQNITATIPLRFTEKINYHE